MQKDFNPETLKELYKPNQGLSKKENGKVTIIGGSSLFHGAPLLSLKTASRIVGMVFFSSPEENLKEIANEIKSKLFSFIWVPWNEIGEYIQKSDAVLIGPGFMRYRSEKLSEFKKRLVCDSSCKQSTEITEKLLKKYSHKKWVIDAGSLQVLKKEWIPKDAILTPNKKEYQLLFGNIEVAEVAKKNNCTIVYKTPIAKVCSSEECVEIKNGNLGLVKGGTGDVQAGLTVALSGCNCSYLCGEKSCRRTL